jgi:SWIM zinc finger
MTTVITPDLRRRDDGDTVGRLAGTLLSVTVAGMADTQRFRRGKSYATSGAVTRLEIRPGTLVGTVSGSAASPYHATIAVTVVERPPGMSARPDREHVKSLIPHAPAMVSTCTCPDASDPCKHVIATLLALAHEISNDSRLLIEWRCDPPGSAPRATIGSRASGTRHLHLVPSVAAAAQTNPFATEAWRAFEGADLPLADLGALPDEVLKIPDLQLDSVDLGQLLRSALAAIRDAHT